MDYAEVRAAFFQPRDGASAEQGTTDGRRLRHVLEPIATIHWWSEPANETWASLGLDFLTGYAWSRACVLGEPSAAVVTSAFGVFAPDAVAGLYSAAREACSYETIIGARADAARAGLQGALGSTDGVAEVAGVLRRAVEAADGTGRPLFSGSAALPWPDDPLTALWHAATTLREYRGDSHLAACAAHAVTGLQANLLTELRVGWEPQSYAGTRGWSPEAMDAAAAQLEQRGLVADGVLTEKGAGIREHIEASTEAQQAAVLDAIGADLEHVIERCGAWSDEIVARGWFPPDPYKRASG